jgi:hypothetical protein
MLKSPTKGQRNKYRITLEIEVNEDFNPYNLNWRKVFDLSGNERVKSYVEDLSLPFKRI